MSEGLGEIIRGVSRGHEAVRQDIIAQARTKGAGIAEKIDLHRRGTQGQDRGPRILGEAFQVDQDIDGVAVNGLRRLQVRKRTDIDETIKGPQKPGPHRATVVRAIGIGADLEHRMVMRLKRLDQQQRGRMVMEIIGQITKPDFFAAFAPKTEIKFFALGRGSFQPLAHPGFRTGAMVAGCEARFGEEKKRRHQGRARRVDQPAPGESLAIAEVVPLAHAARPNE